jgi:hypothetical protein
MFFVVVGVAQLMAGWFLTCGIPSLAVAGLSALGTLGVILMYLVSRTVGLPVGPHPGVAEEAGFLDMFTTLLEAVVVGLLAVTVASDLARRPLTFGGKPRYGLLLVGAGIGLQFLALGIDTLLLEPGSTAGNGAILNPTLVVSLGIALATAGVFKELIELDIAGSPIARFLPRPGLGSFAFAWLGGFTAVIALMTNGLGAAGTHGGAEGTHAHADAGLHATASEEELAKDPVYQSLQQLLSKQGTEAAIARLQQLVADPAVLRMAHPYAHALGRFSFSHYGGASEAFQHCTADFASGCYHGVLEEYLKTRPVLEAKDIVSLCGSGIATPDIFVKFQCLHGLGHGLTLLYQHDIFKALQYCDYLGADWDRQSCYGGVFMENIIFASEPHDHGGEHKTFLNRDEPLYPCTIVATQYRYQCYNLQSSAILMFNGQNYAQTAKECDKAPEQYISVCYMSLGRDISGATLRNPNTSIEFCLQGTQSHWGDCLAGVAKDFVNTDYNPDAGLALCGKAPDSTKTSCYGAIGEMLLSLYSDPIRRAQECERAEPNYVAACRAAARL